MRINKLITKEKIPWSFIKFSQLILKGNIISLENLYVGLNMNAKAPNQPFSLLPVTCEQHKTILMLAYSPKINVLLSLDIHVLKNYLTFLLLLPVGSSTNQLDKEFKFTQSKWRSPSDLQWKQNKQNQNKTKQKSASALAEKTKWMLFRYNIII